MKADIWSLGVMLYEMLFGKCPFEGKNIAELIDLIHEYDMKFPEEYKISQKTQNLIRRMLSKDFKKRIEWEQIVAEVLELPSEGNQNYKPLPKSTLPPLPFKNISPKNKQSNSEHFIPLNKIQSNEENKESKSSGAFTTNNYHNYTAHSNEKTEIHYYTPSHHTHTSIFHKKLKKIKK